MEDLPNLFKTLVAGLAERRAQTARMDAMFLEILKRTAPRTASLDQLEETLRGARDLRDRAEDAVLHDLMGSEANPLNLTLLLLFLR
jgi:hypothetical protein